LLVVHEDNRTAGFGAEILATVMEKAGVPIAARRIAREDGYVPFRFEAQLDVLPSYRRILETAADMLGLDLAWDAPRETSGPVPVNAIGSGPADEEVEVVDVLVKVGDEIKVGDLVAVVEATKAAVDVQSTVDGKVVEVAVELKQKVPVGAPLVFVEAETRPAGQRAPTAERIDNVRLTPRVAPLSAPAIAAPVAVPIGVSGIAGVTGGL